MALKPDRIETQTDVSFFMNNATSSTIERGGIASLTAGGGSGVAMDDSSAVVVYATAASGTEPVGVLLNDVVNIDLTRQHINWHKDEVQGGGKVTLLQVGQVTTDKVTGTIVAGQSAYLGASGLFTATAPSDNDTENENYRVGRFLSSRDLDGYCKVAVNIA
tara:strand:- start:157 stop:642 length:486 start_codon:yes stop_codon:yes gene_type:complete